MCRLASVIHPDQADKYELFRKEIAWWGDVHSGVHDGQLVGLLAIKSEGIIKALMVQFMDSTRLAPSQRAIENALRKLDFELSKSAHETSMTKIGLRPTFQRRSNELRRQFWTRWGN